MSDTTAVEYGIHFRHSDDGTYVDRLITRPTLPEATALAEDAYRSGMFDQVEIACWHPFRMGEEGLGDLGACWWLTSAGWLLRANDAGDIVDDPHSPPAGAVIV